MKSAVLPPSTTSIAALGSAHDLKRRFAGRAIFEVRADRPVDAMRLLDAMEDIEKTSIFGTAVHAVVQKGRPLTHDDIAGRLSSNGLVVTSVHAVRPSLEDVFLDVAQEAA